MSGSTQNIVLTLFGIGIGFIFNFILARIRARTDLKSSITADKAQAYIELWRLCDQHVDAPKVQQARAKKLQSWYHQGGGLFLSYKATDHFVRTMQLLEQEAPLTPTELDELKSHLSWLRTEMKHEVGTYTRKEADMKLPSIKQAEQEEEAV